MTPNETQPFFKKERSQTDDSLTCERGKADEGLKNFRRKAELKTDTQLEADRSEADLARAQSRDGRDLETPANGEVYEQRRQEDDSIQSERSSMDAAIRLERASKEAVLNEFLHKERTDTDDKLLHERKSTDQEVSKTSNRLRDEVNQHTITKAELTTRDELIALVSHDLRSPISAVFSCAEMLLEDPAIQDISTETKYWIEFMKRNAATSLRLISDILDMERIAEGKLQLDIKRENLGEIVRQACELHVHTASAKGVLLRMVPVGKPVFAMCDRDRIAQVLSNLIGNAVKFTNDGGTITIRLNETESQYQISVTDTGKGIAEADLVRIFDRYAQLDKKDARGIGLGLYICKTLISSHGGEINVESTIDKGSKFAFTLPK